MSNELGRNLISFAFPAILFLTEVLLCLGSQFQDVRLDDAFCCQDSLDTDS